MSANVLSVWVFVLLWTALDSQADVLEQVTVTATRDSVAFGELESNLSWVDSEALRLVNHEHISQVLVRIPGTWISRGNGQEHLSAIRSPVLTGAGGCGAFYMAQDGISLRAPGFCNANQLFDANSEQAHRVEVVRGPAGVTYGSNAVHGAINILTPNILTPESEGSSGYVSLSAGPHDYYRTGFQLRHSDGEQGFLVYGNGASDGGYKDDSGFDQQKINLIHQGQFNKIDIKTVLAATNLNQETAGFIRGFRSYKDSTLKKTNPNPEAFRDSQSFRAYSLINYALNDVSSINFSPYIRWTDMAFLQHFLPWQPLEENSQKSMGFKSNWQRDFNTLRWLAGIDIDHTRGTLKETQSSDFSPNIPAGAHYDYEVIANVYSPFTTLKWDLNQAWQMRAGLRYEYTRFDYSNQLEDGSACAADVDNCRFTRPADQVVNYDELSYQLGTNARLSNRHRLYAQFSSGYRAPQATELFRLQSGQQVAELDAEHINSGEIGIRGHTSQWLYDINIFVMDKDNFIFQDANRINISSGETSHQGIEFLFSYQLPADFSFDMNGTWARHRYESNLELSRDNIQDNEIDTAPEHLGSAQLAWRNNSMEIELEWAHTGNYFLNPENTAAYRGHNLVNLRTRLQVSKQLELSARILNLDNKDYAERADFGFGSYRYFVGQPRSAFLSLTYRAI